MRSVPATVGRRAALAVLALAEGYEIWDLEQEFIGSVRDLLVRLANLGALAQELVVVRGGRSLHAQAVGVGPGDAYRGAFRRHTVATRTARGCAPACCSDGEGAMRTGGNPSGRMLVTVR